MRDRRLKTTVLLTALAVLVLSCNKERHNNRSRLEAKSGKPISTDADVSVGLTSKIAVRNFSQISATMSALTGIPQSHPQIVKYYATIENQLPLSNDMESFLPSHQVSIAKLAMSYCDSMLSNPELSAKFFGAYSLAETPTKAFSPAQRSLLIGTVTDKFWSTGLAILPSKESSDKALNNLIDELLVGEDETQSEVTVKIVKGVCTSVLASSPVSMF